MVLVLASELGVRELELVQTHLPNSMIVPAVGDASLELVHSLPIALFITQFEPLTTTRLQAYLEVRKSCPQAVTVGFAPQDVREQLRSEQIPVPDFWLDDGALSGTAAEVLQTALQQAQARLEQTPWPISGSGHGVASANPQAGEEQRLLQHLLSALIGQPDPDHLLSAYVEVVSELTHCAGHCLLRRSAGGSTWTVASARGLSPEIVAHGRLGSSDALIGWYRHSSRALTRAELAQWSDTNLAGHLARELAVFRGHVALPLLVQGRLEGLLLLGEKIIGEPYGRPELETLFLLSNMVALQLENLQLQARLLNTKTHLERSLAGMECGLITMNADQTVAVCNPYAARVLGQRREELEGADLRCLPSPLGDLLYAAWQVPEATTIGREVTLAGTQTTLRVSTSRLADDQGQPLGSVLLLEDITAPLAEAAQSARQTTVDTLARIVGRIAHEVRTPLTAIKTYAELKKQPHGNGDLERFWKDTVGPELSRLDRLIGDQVRLLEPVKPELQMVDLAALVREAVERVLPTEPDSEMNADVQVAEDVPRVVADPAGTRDAVTYLLRYLLREAGSPVKVRLTREVGGPLPEVHLRLQTTVDGSNFDPLRILDPLIALQDPHSDLGPAIAAQILERQGTCLQADLEGGNVIFRVHFPINVTVRDQAPEGEPYGQASHPDN